MLSTPFNKGDFYEPHAADWLALVHSICSLNRQSELKVTHANTPTGLPASRTSFSGTIASCRKTVVVMKQSNDIFAGFLTSTAKI